MDRIPGGQGTECVSGLHFPSLMHFYLSLPRSVPRAFLFSLGAGDTVSSLVASDGPLCWTLSPSLPVPGCFIKCLSVKPFERATP